MLELVKIMVVTEDTVSALQVLTVRVDYRQMETSLGMGEGCSWEERKLRDFLGVNTPV